MKVLAFFGSPRLNGNSGSLLKEALKPIEEAGHEIISFRLNLMNLKPCQNCGGCEKTGECVIKDDMTDIYKGIREADRIILASPIFFFALSAQTKTMIDRCQAFWSEKYLLKKTIPEGQYGRKGLLLLVGGMKRDIGIKCSESIAKAFFRTISVSAHETLGYLSIDAKGDIFEHPTALQDAYNAGKKLIQT